VQEKTFYLTGDFWGGICTTPWGELQNKKINKIIP